MGSAAAKRGFGQRHPLCVGGRPAVTLDRKGSYGVWIEVSAQPLEPKILRIGKQQRRGAAKPIVQLVAAAIFRFDIETQYRHGCTCAGSLRESSLTSQR
jgi:hypothetical protein